MTTCWLSADVCLENNQHVYLIAVRFKCRTLIKLECTLCQAYWCLSRRLTALIRQLVCIRYRNTIQSRLTVIINVYMLCTEETSNADFDILNSNIQMTIIIWEYTCRYHSLPRYNFRMNSEKHCIVFVTQCQFPFGTVLFQYGSRKLSPRVMFTCSEHSSIHIGF